MAIRNIETFYRENGKAVYAYLVAVCGDRRLAEDLMQDTFVRATRSFGGYRGGDPRSWLLAIARSVFIDHTRRKRPLPIENLPERPIVDPDITERDLIDRVLTKLPLRQRTALLLCDGAGLGYSEVAGHMGISEGAAKVLIHRARLAFRKEYGEADR